MSEPLNKVVFIQKIAAFAPLSLSKFVGLAYVNQSWADTIKNYSFHTFDMRHHNADKYRMWCEKLFKPALRRDIFWLVHALVTEAFFTKVDDVLHLTCTYSSSPKMLALIFEKIVEEGGHTLLKYQMSADVDKESSLNSLMCVCRFSSSVKMLELLCKKIVHVGGFELLEEHITTESNHWSHCLMLVCQNDKSTTEMIAAVLDKIVAVGGNTLLKTLIATRDPGGYNSVMLLCRCGQPTPDMIKLILEKTFAVGGTDLVKATLSTVDTGGWNLLRISCGWVEEDSLKVITGVLHALGLFKEQYASLRDSSKARLREDAGINDDSWVPSAADEENLLDFTTSLLSTST